MQLSCESVADEDGLRRLHAVQLSIQAEEIDLDFVESSLLKISFDHLSPPAREDCMTGTGGLGMKIGSKKREQLVRVACNSAQLGDSGASLTVRGSNSDPKSTFQEYKPQVDVPVYPKDTRPEVRVLTDTVQADTDTWFTKTDVKLGELTDAEHDMITRLLYMYKDLNSIELENLAPTDLYVHRVRLKKATPPFSRLKQRSWPPGKEFWMR